MATTETQIRARTGKQFLDELAKDEREIWLNGEKITNPLEHPLLVSGAESIARVFDLQHEHADEMLMPSPDDGSLEVEVKKGQNLNDIFAVLSAQGIEIVSMRNKANRLEELFLRLVEGRDAATGEPRPAVSA